MSGLPKLRIKNYCIYPFSEEMRDLEQAQDFLFNMGDAALVVVEGQLIYSYGELVQLAAKDDYKDRESLEVWVMPAGIDGG